MKYHRDKSNRPNREKIIYLENLCVLTRAVESAHKSSDSDSDSSIFKTFDSDSDSFIKPQYVLITVNL
jgi:hypothetical protein